MLSLCFCKRFRINPEHAAFVKNGVPMCSQATCQKVAEHRALRRTSDFDDIEFDNVPDEIHAKPDECIFGWKPCSSP